MKPISATSCVDAWLRACDHLLLQDDGHRDYNLFLEIGDPMSMTSGEREVCELLNRFLTDRDGMPLTSVINTIFPAQLYQRYGADGVYKRYLKEVYPKIRKYGDCGWGTYAQRLLERTGPKGETIYPLADLVEKIRQQLKVSNTKRAAYELGVIEPFLDIPLYEPGHDRKYLMGGPCLSHISFKVSKERLLYLTAVYRNHYYVQRALGNLLGLAHLQYFVAKEAGLEVGPLACLSTCASLDTKSATESSSGRWGTHDVETLLASCHHALSAETETV